MVINDSIQRGTAPTGFDRHRQYLQLRAILFVNYYGTRSRDFEQTFSESLHLLLCISLYSRIENQGSADKTGITMRMLFDTPLENAIELSLNSAPLKGQSQLRDVWINS